MHHHKSYSCWIALSLVHIKHYNACLNDWMLSNPGKPVTIYSGAGIIGKICQQGIYQAEH
jgi:hypothetical protein